jgi:hypothetical protein
MWLTHEIAGIVIAVMGITLIALAGPIPRQISRWHVHAIELIEPAMLTWLARIVGAALFILGIVTILNTPA